MKVSIIFRFPFCVEISILRKLYSAILKWSCVNIGVFNCSFAIASVISFCSVSRSDSRFNIRYMLSNRVYIGEYRHMGVVIKDSVPPLVLFPVRAGNFTLGQYIINLFYRLSVVTQLEYLGNDRRGFRVYI